VTVALAEARPGKVVCSSTIGADAPHENLLTQRTLIEHSLKQIGPSVTFLLRCSPMSKAKLYRQLSPKLNKHQDSLRIASTECV
jgi:hypothetical protein